MLVSRHHDPTGLSCISKDCVNASVYVILVGVQVIKTVFKIIEIV
jgi:hypothetical protein